MNSHLHFPTALPTRLLKSNREASLSALRSVQMVVARNTRTHNQVVPVSSRPKFGEKVTSAIMEPYGEEHQHHPITTTLRFPPIRNFRHNRVQAKTLSHLLRLQLMKKTNKTGEIYQPSRGEIVKTSRSNLTKNATNSIKKMITHPLIQAVTL